MKDIKVGDIVHVRADTPDDGFPRAWIGDTSYRTVAVADLIRIEGEP